MKEYTKKVILLTAICLVTLSILAVAIKLHENRENNLSANSKIKEYLTEIKYEEIRSHVVEQPSTIIYVSNSSEDSTHKFDKIFAPVIKKYNLENEIIYININETTIIDPVYQNAPEIVFYKDGEVSEVVDTSSLKNSKDVIKMLKERGVIGD